MPAVLEIRHLAKSFGGVKALQGVDLTVRRVRSTDSWARTARGNRP